MATKEEEVELLVNLCGYVWMICWILAIWIAPLRAELFFTGLFMFFIGLVSVSCDRKGKDEKKRA